MYGHDAVDRVRLVRRALQVGFTLTELSGIAQVRDGGGAPCHRVLSLTEEKLHSLKAQIKELRRTERYVKELVREWRLKLGRIKPGTKAMLLHSLAERPNGSANSTSNFKKRRQS